MPRQAVQCTQITRQRRLNVGIDGQRRALPGLGDLALELRQPVGIAFGQGGRGFGGGSCDGFLDLGLGLGQAQLARDQAREECVAEGGQGLGLFLIFRNLSK